LLAEVEEINSQFYLSKSRVASYFENAHQAEILAQHRLLALNRNTTPFISLAKIFKSSIVPRRSMHVIKGYPAILL
jgi:hypothetical protein